MNLFFEDYLSCMRECYVKEKVARLKFIITVLRCQEKASIFLRFCSNLN